MTRPRESGFTLPELVMAVTILGIIAATIGAVLFAAFSSTTGLNDRFDGSRAAKQTSLYWTPDVQSVETVNPTGVQCGDGTGPGSVPLLTFESTDYPTSDAVLGTDRVATWWLDDTSPARVTRQICENHGSPLTDPRYPIVERIAAGDQETAGVATSVAEARGQVAAECSTDGVAFHPCATEDPGTIIRLTVRVPDTPTSRDPATPNTPRFTTYQFSVAGTRAVR